MLAGGNLFATILKSLAGLLVARLVSPATLGLFNGIGVVQMYVPLLQIGVSQGLTRELPYQLGRGDRARAHELASTAQRFAQILGVVVALALLVPAGVTLLRGEVQNAAGWGTHALVAGALVMQLHLLALYRTSDDFQRLAGINVLNGMLNLALLVAVWLFDYYGLAVRALCIWAVTVGVMWWRRPIRVPSRFVMPDFKVLVRTGLPILLTTQMVTVWIAVHRTLAITLLGKYAFGLYAIGMLVEQALLQLVGAFQQINLPRVAARYAETHRLGSLLRITVRPTVVVAALTASCATVGWFLLPPAVQLFLPQYVEGIPAAQWSMVSAVAMSPWPFMNSFTAIRRQIPHGLAVLTGMAAYAAGLWGLQSGQEWELVAFPQALVIGRLTYGAVGVGMLAMMALAERRR